MAAKKSEQSIKGNIDFPYYKPGEYAYIVHPVHEWKLRKVCINTWSKGVFKLSTGEYYNGFAYMVSAAEALEDIICVPEIYLRKDYEAGDWYELGTSISWGENILNIKSGEE